MSRSGKLLILCIVAVLAESLLRPQTSFAQTASPQASDARTACASDAQRLCAGVQPGGGRIVACLKEHKDSLSDPCKQAAGLPVNPSSSSAPSAPPSASSGSETAASDGPAAAAPSPSAPAAAATPATKSSHAAGTAPASKAKPAPAPKGTPLVILGERFVQRTVVDTQQGGMTAVTVHIPESWHFESKIEWHYGWVAYPVNPSWHAENPANAEAYFQYESWQLVDMYVAPRWRQYVKQPKVGDRYFSGQIHMVPVPPLQAMAAFIKNIRGDVANLEWLGQQDLPDLAKTLRLPPSPNQHGVAIKIGYDLNGKPVEEAFFGVYFMNKAGAPAMQAGHQAMGANEMIETNWGLQGLQSFRAPAGTLDKRMPVYCLIAKSVQADPKWLARHAAILATLTQMFNQKLQQGWDQIRAADALTDETMRQQAQFLDNVGRQEVAMRSSGGSVDSFLRPDGSGGGGGGGRTSSDNVSDLIRNVDTMNDPSTGDTKQVSNLGGYNHFTDGFGNYRTYDDPNATPRKTKAKMAPGSG
jgi:hypothetical protein